MPSIIVDDAGTELYYIDSGAPTRPDSVQDYITIFAIHGIVYNGAIFRNVIELAPQSGLRIVAPNRRGYPGSTPLSSEDHKVLTDGTEEQKEEFVLARAVEIATFIHRFIEIHKLPRISDDGKSGGVALLGWSLGSALAHSAISSVDSMPDAIQSGFKQYMRALILFEAPTSALGTPKQDYAWYPLMDTSLPLSARWKMFTQWITSYFAHGDLSKRDLNLLSHFVPATFRPPSIFSMSTEQIAEMVCESTAITSDSPFTLRFSQQMLASHRKAFFDKELRQRVPHMKVWVLVGDSTGALAFPAFWNLQDEDAQSGGGFINFRTIKGVNHFMHWDDPQVAIDHYFEAVA